MLGSTPLILFAIYFLPKLNTNFILKEIKLWISCISSCLYHVWCHLTEEKKPDIFIFSSVTNNRTREQSELQNYHQLYCHVGNDSCQHLKL
jgi:hypothetical protein